jgi:hypothetical protein
MMISGTAAFSGNVIPEDWIWIALTGLVIWLPSFVIHWRLRVRRDLELRRLEASQPQPAPVIVTRDQPVETASAAAPVLYLRSFDDDQRSSRTKGNLTEEELLVHLMGHFGPVMAVGRPGEAIRPVGAQRVYLRDADWQQVVEDLIRRARLVVMRTGRTSGLQWELSRALEALQPEQLIVVVDDKKELRGFLQLIRRVHPEAPHNLRIGCAPPEHCAGSSSSARAGSRGCCACAGPHGFSTSTKMTLIPASNSPARCGRYSTGWASNGQDRPST